MTNTGQYLPMHRAAFITYPGFELLDVGGPVSVFNEPISDKHVFVWQKG